MRFQSAVCRFIVHRYKSVLESEISKHAGLVSVEFFGYRDYSYRQEKHAAHLRIPSSYRYSNGLPRLHR